ncbi:class I SAM-dependent methyltransferase [Usitatibacter palustris]|uniref:2-methoxy-6-polyprenyl-1,4-benzoquinol methylase, mitochondrial n=1 Tax=Usitatibacter palustris TaxID=2732487 RepID=A0A6M4H547_9PROT|nr:methyltransferase domain-containing protein [Usitatibacter palustris]QJR14600.1 2-methoxy-6-polyprenyl-1,4-benzoquinol methylase, mitochondrial [Usitatibacter palustris]
MSGANLAESLEHYRKLAPRYDRRTQLIDNIRNETIAALDLRAGDFVLDAGCGTGWCLPKLAAAVCTNGHVFAFDPSPEMLEIAAHRVSDSGFANVDLQCATAEDYRAPVPFDAILLSYTHDILRSRTSLANLMRLAKPGARVAATSTKLYAPWLAPANWYLRLSHRGYITNFEGMDAPWSLMPEFLTDFRVRTSPFSQHYIATGRVRQDA